ncbi:(2,3-dihydroxybenzoyl)adenylate synthase [Georgenia yuyongxinii]|uniref:(2,3-dihydroxybenzoyl)adenylate synthase n=1 Tax=Georgenia yuyongxinii TaxID=2589797 RepID=A0A552WTV6_9MICO|nr:(2,3-dihydroxybenzoyl)adenylate synthase [Georgenia yuyongxinii]TRW46268.1 (2,3-dihydroxybenzoyl)adenylate synthase [Georgenia yuyongxinii]
MSVSGRAAAARAPSTRTILPVIHPRALFTQGLYTLRGYYRAEE